VQSNPPNDAAINPVGNVIKANDDSSKNEILDTVPALMILAGMQSQGLSAVQLSLSLHRPSRRRLIGHGHDRAPL
jgi:hypothetical protein